MDTKDIVIKCLADDLQKSKAEIAFLQAQLQGFYENSKHVIHVGTDTSDLGVENDADTFQGEIKELVAQVFDNLPPLPPPMHPMHPMPPMPPMHPLSVVTKDMSSGDAGDAGDAKDHIQSARSNKSTSSARAMHGYDLQIHHGREKRMRRDALDALDAFNAFNAGEDAHDAHDAHDGMDHVMDCKVPQRSERFVNPYCHRNDINTMWVWLGYEPTKETRVYLEELFGLYGTIADIYFPKGKYHVKIRMHSCEEVHRAIRYLNGRIIPGNSVMRVCHYRR